MVALATASTYPTLDEDSATLLPALESLGVHARCAVWDDPAVDWAAFGLCLVRSTWDYWPRQAEYVRWAERVAGVSTLWNPVDIIRWNTDKAYLREIECWGFQGIPTLWLEAGTELRFGQAVSALGSPREVVIKPRVSAGGFDTHRVPATAVDEGQAILERMLPTHDLMVQPYLSRIETTGEMSLIFLGGGYSHAVRKVPPAGEFRSQEEWGSEITAATPRADELAYARALMERVGSRVAYARVDLVRDDADGLCLAELELTEPALYLRYDDGAATRLAEWVREGVEAVAGR